MSTSAAFSYLPCVTPRFRTTWVGVCQWVKVVLLFISCLESVGGLCDVLASRVGQYTLICLICHQWCRVPVTTGRSVAVWCGCYDWLCVFTGEFLISFGWPRNYRVQGVISRIFGLWTLECVFRGNVNIHRAPKAFVYSSSDHQTILLGFPCLSR